LASTIRRLALNEGMISLRRDAVRKVVAGQTTPAEILRAVYLEEWGRARDTRPGRGVL
jgi:type II secretory ATPase GspE/PulE/Tfp pilus assembly ATPase PilB-like protein